jgi:hypothetical protein
MTSIISSSFVACVAPFVCRKEIPYIAFNKGTVVPTPSHMDDVQKVIYAISAIKWFNKTSFVAKEWHVMYTKSSVLVQVNTKRMVKTPYGHSQLNVMVIMPYLDDVSENEWLRRARKIISKDCQEQQVSSIQFSK